MTEKKAEYWQLKDGQAYEIVDWLDLYEINGKDDAVKKGGKNTVPKVGPLKFIRWGRDEAADALYGLRWGPGYRRLLKTAKELDLMTGVALGWFGKFLEIAGSKMRDYRGWVTDGSNKPMDSERLAEELGVPVEEIEAALKMLCHERVNWVAVRDYKLQKQVKKASTRKKPPKTTAKPTNPGIRKNSGTNGPEKFRTVQEPEHELTEREPKELKTEPEHRPEQTDGSVSFGGAGSVGLPGSTPLGSEGRSSGDRSSGGSEIGSSEIGSSVGGGAGQAFSDFEHPAITDGRQRHWMDQLGRRNLLSINPNFILDELPKQQPARQVEAVFLAKIWMGCLFTAELESSNQQGRRDRGIFFGVNGKPGLLKSIYDSGGAANIVRALKAVQDAKQKMNGPHPLYNPMGFINKKFQAIVGKPLQAIIGKPP